MTDSGRSFSDTLSARARHALSIIAILFTIFSGLGTTVSAVLEAKFTRSDDAVIVLNANEFDWRGVKLIIWGPEGEWNAKIDTLPAGESLRVGLSSLGGESGPFLPGQHPEALVAVIVDDANGLRGETHGQKLVDLPLERRSRQSERP